MFPILGVLMVVLILTSPLFGWPFAFLSENAFARFCMFWCLAVCSVLSFANKYMRPATVAIIATGLSLVVAAAFYLIYQGFHGIPTDLSTFLLSCLAGGILGALAGTWLIYVLEVYTTRR